MEPEASPPSWEEILPTLSPQDQLTVLRMLAWNDAVDRLTGREA